MQKLTAEVEKSRMLLPPASYFLGHSSVAGANYTLSVGIFNLANGVMSQPSPNVRDVNQYRQLVENIGIPADPTDHLFSAENYRLLGLRPSRIDAWLHSFFEWTSTWSIMVFTYCFP
jgi:hypothetical protein